MSATDGRFDRLDAPRRHGLAAYLPRHVIMRLDPPHPIEQREEDGMRIFNSGHQPDCASFCEDANSTSRSTSFAARS